MNNTQALINAAREAVKNWQPHNGFHTIGFHEAMLELDTALAAINQHYTDPPVSGYCDKCGSTLTNDEIYYYGNECEFCIPRVKQPTGERKMQ